MHGIQRVPALCFNDPLNSIEESELRQYEILGKYFLSKRLTFKYVKFPYRITKSG